MIGVFDSGVGGLCALRCARRCMPEADFVYFADTRHLPYGERAPCEILALCRQALALLAREGADAILAACGTVSSLVLPAMAKQTDLPLFGVAEPAAQAAARAARDRGGDIALLATAATVQAGFLARDIAARIPGVQIHALACPLFVHLAESGTTAPSDPLARMSAARILAPLQGKPIRTVVLGCTHFSCLTGLLAEFFPRAAMIDAAAEGAAAMAAALPPSAKTGHGSCRFLTSGDAGAFSRAAGNLLGQPVVAQHADAGVIG